jgi:TonB family protein
MLRATLSCEHAMNNRSLWCVAGLLCTPAFGDAGEDVPLAHSAALPPISSDAAVSGASVSLLETNLELDRLVARGELADALPIAHRLVELSEQEFGRRSRQTADAMFRLADVQRSSGRHGDAAASYLAVVDILRTVDGPFTPLAIAPLTALGETYQLASSHVEALSAFREARSVSRRAYGLHNVAQIGLLDRMTTSLEIAGQYIEANDLQRAALALVTRENEPHSAQTLDAIYKYAGWLAEVGQHQAERDQYTTAVRIIREHYGKDDLRLVEPLRAIGNSYRRELLLDSNGSRALHNALELIERQDRPDPVKLAEVLRDLGDWTVAFRGGVGRSEEYRRAWRSLDGVEGGDALREQWFSGLRYVVEAPVDRTGLSTDADALEGSVLVQFKVSATGYARDVVVLESTPPGLKDDAVLRHVKQSLFRPQIVGGELALAQPITARFRFRYAAAQVAQQR